MLIHMLSTVLGTVSTWETVAVVVVIRQGHTCLDGTYSQCCKLYTRRCISGCYCWQTLNHFARDHCKVGGSSPHNPWMQMEEGLPSRGTERMCLEKDTLQRDFMPWNEALEPLDNYGSCEQNWFIIRCSTCKLHDGRGFIGLVYSGNP